MSDDDDMIYTTTPPTSGPIHTLNLSKSIAKLKKSIGEYNTILTKITAIKNRIEDLCVSGSDNTDLEEANNTISTLAEAMEKYQTTILLEINTITEYLNRSYLDD